MTQHDSMHNDDDNDDVQTRLSRQGRERRVVVVASVLGGRGHKGVLRGSFGGQEGVVAEASTGGVERGDGARLVERREVAAHHLGQKAHHGVLVRIQIPAISQSTRPRPNTFIYPERRQRGRHAHTHSIVNRPQTIWQSTSKAKHDNTTSTVRFPAYTTNMRTALKVGRRVTGGNINALNQ